MLRGGDPEPRLPVIKGLVLVGEVDTFLIAACGILATLGKSTGALRQLGANGGILHDPVGEGIFAILNDTAIGLAIVSSNCAV
jgi:hypothetical protein